MTPAGSVPRVALVGCGAWGKNLARALYELGSLALICDPTPEGAANAAAMAPQIPCHGSLEKALGPTIDAVVVATPAATHYRLSAQALAAGKDVFVEKPITLHYAEAHDLVTQAALRGRVLMVGHVLEYHPAMVIVRRMVADGDLGELHYIYSNRLNLGKVRREENALWSFAPHDFAIILRLFGRLPERVVSCGGAYLQPGIADVTMTHLTFHNGAQGHVFVSWLHPFKEQRLVVVGSRNMVSFDDVNKCLMLYDRRVELRENVPVPIAGLGREIPFSSEEPLTREMAAFLAAVQTRVPPLTDGQSGATTLQVLEAAQQSLQQGGMPVVFANPSEPLTN